MSLWEFCSGGVRVIPGGVWRLGGQYGLSGWCGHLTGPWVKCWVVSSEPESPEPESPEPESPEPETETELERGISPENRDFPL